MKHFTYLRWLLASLVLCVGTTTALGTEVNYTFASGGVYSGSGNTGKITWTTDYCTIVQEKNSSSNNVSNSYVTAPRWYANHTVTVTPATGVTITKIVIYCSSGSYNGQTITANTGSVTASGNNSTWEGSVTSSEPLVLQLGKQCRPSSIDVTFSTSGVVVTCATPTFSPAAGAVASGTEVTISTTTAGATIHYTTDGSTPTSSSATYSSPIEITSATTINAIAVASGYDNSAVATAEYTVITSVSGYNIDFESPVESYTDWTITNVGRRNTVTTHGGSYYGTNANTAGNATTTASIQTKTAVANPGTFTCYLSKEGTNTNANSNWKIQVSDDASTWTDVETHAAASGITAGTWTEFTADLTSYSNVYVRLYYDGTNAIRAVDDISLTTVTPAAVLKPVITVADDEFFTSTTATITCATDGATIYYSYDNSTWTQYTEALTLTATTTIYAKAVKGEDTSEIASATATKIAVKANIAALVADGANGDYVQLTNALVTYVNGINAYLEDASGAILIYKSGHGLSAGDKLNGIMQVTNYNSSYNGLPEITNFTLVEGYEKTTGNTVTPTVVTIAQLQADYSSYLSRYVTIEGATVTSAFSSKNSTIEQSGNSITLRDQNSSATLTTTVNDVVNVTGHVAIYNSTQQIALYEQSQIYVVPAEQQEPTITVPSNATTPYGTAYTFDDSGVSGGAITLSSSNTAVATVSGLVITPVAVGTVTITVSTAEDEYYYAGSEDFTLTVTAPEGLATKPSGAASTIFYESFDTNDGKGGNDDSWSGNIATGTLLYDNEGWTVVSGSKANQCAKFGTGSAAGSATTPALALEAGITYTLTFKAAAWNGNSEKTSLSLSATGATLSEESITLVKGEWTEYEVTITNASDGATITFSAPNASNNRFFLDEVTVTKPATVVVGPTVRTAASGFASYCYEYPIDFSELPDGVKAYYVSEATASSAKFTELTGAVKGGVPFILQGDASTDYQLTLTDASTVPSDNQLRGTLAPTYVEQVENGYTNFGLSSGAFVKMKAGTVNAHKAFLPIANSVLSGEVKSISITFEEATGIDRTERIPLVDDAAWYDLSGRRVAQPTRGLYIHGGKKVFVK